MNGCSCVRAQHFLSFQFLYHYVRFHIELVLTAIVCKHHLVSREHPPVIRVRFFEDGLFIPFLHRQQSPILRAAPIRLER